MLVACTMLVGQDQGASNSSLNCTVDPNNLAQIIIRADDSVAKPVKLTDVDSVDAWTLYSISGTKQKSTHRLTITAAKMVTPSPQNTHLSLILAEAIPEGASIQGLVATKTSVINISTCASSLPPPSEKQLYKAATGKTDSDIYLNGSYTPTVGGSPTYSIDAFAGYMKAIPSETNPWGKLGGYGQVTTKSGSTSPNPNSYLAYAVFQRVLAETGGWKGPFQTPFLNFRLAGGEFDQTGNNLNFVTSPILTFPFRFTSGTLGPISPSVTIPSMTLIAGVEFVNTITAPLPEADWITRGLFGATFSAGYAPKKPGFDSIVFTASSQVRILSSPEVYYNDSYAVTDPKTGKKTTPPRLGTQPRPYVDAKLTYNFEKWVGGTFEYTYGSLPPAFVLKHSTFQLGLSFSLQQASYGRYSILKP
jgi:hypothetical protein